VRLLPSKLTRTEAIYLRERILSNASRTMLAFMVDQGEIAKHTDFPWQHHQLHEFPPHVRDLMNTRATLSEVIHGAALLYNLMLAEAKQAREREEVCAERLEAWTDNVATRRAPLLAWDRDSFWDIIASGNQRVRYLTRIFISGWINLVLSQQTPARIFLQQVRSADDSGARETTQEIACSLNLSEPFAFKQL